MAENVPGGQMFDGSQVDLAAGESGSPAGAEHGPETNHESPRLAEGAGRPAAEELSAPIGVASLADPLLALAADVLDDLEKVRIANENRLRQLTRSAEDSDGETRGFGLDESHPDVARLAALVKMLAEAEHQAELNLGRLMRKHPLGPWVRATAGIGEKQGARLLAAIGDPYVRPEIVREDGAVEPSRPRLVSELLAYSGYHVIHAPVSGHPSAGNHALGAADGSGIPADHPAAGAHSAGVGGDQAGRPGYFLIQGNDAGVAPKRQRGQHANWSATAKMRAYLVAVSCMKCMESPYRAVYEDTRAKYADAIHQVPCVRCGPKGKPAEPGTSLSDGHKHARALRAVAKVVLRDLWREARRIHEPPGGHQVSGIHPRAAAGITSPEEEGAR